MSNKIEEVVKIGEDVKDTNMDIYDIAAILVSDIHDMMTAKNPKEFVSQKRDLNNTLKVLKRNIRNKTFKGVKHFKK